MDFPTTDMAFAYTYHDIPLISIARCRERYLANLLSGCPYNLGCRVFVEEVVR